MRYATVADLADDIRRHLAREPVVARHPTLGYRAKCLVKRNGSRLVASAAVVIVLAGVLFAFWARSQQNVREAGYARESVHQRRIPGKVSQSCPSKTWVTKTLRHILPMAFKTIF